MITNVLGRTGLEVTQLGYGSMGLRGPKTWGVRTVSEQAAERLLVSLSKVADLTTARLRYLNRLSDLLFVMARVLARADGGEEVFLQAGQLSYLPLRAVNGTDIELLFQVDNPGE